MFLVWKRNKKTCISLIENKTMEKCFRLFDQSSMGVEINDSVLNKWLLWDAICTKDKRKACSFRTLPLGVYFQDYFGEGNKTRNYPIRYVCRVSIFVWTAFRKFHSNVFTITEVILLSTNKQYNKVKQLNGCSALLNYILFLPCR